MFGRSKPTQSAPEPVVPEPPPVPDITMEEISQDPFLSEIYFRSIEGFAGRSYVSDVAWNAYQVTAATARMRKKQP